MGLNEVVSGYSTFTNILRVDRLSTDPWEIWRHGLRDKVSHLILTYRFWKKAKEPLVKVLKLVNQDKKPTLPIIYKAMDRA